MAQNYFHKMAAVWGNDVVRSLKHSQRAVEESQREREARELKRREAAKQEISRRPENIRRAHDFAPHQTNQRSRGIRM
jgi:hypothetical protein